MSYWEPFPLFSGQFPNDKIPKKLLIPQECPPLHLAVPICLLLLPLLHMAQLCSFFSSLSSLSSLSLNLPAMEIQDSLVKVNLNLSS